MEKKIGWLIWAEKSATFTHKLIVKATIPFLFQASWLFFYYYFVSPFYSAIVRWEIIIDRHRRMSEEFLEVLSSLISHLHLSLFRWAKNDFIIAEADVIFFSRRHERFVVDSRLRYSSSINFAQRWKISSSSHIFVYNNIYPKEWDSFFSVCRRTTLLTLAKARRSLR